MSWTCGGARSRCQLLPKKKLSPLSLSTSGWLPAVPCGGRARAGMHVATRKVEPGTFLFQRDLPSVVDSASVDRTGGALPD